MESEYLSSLSEDKVLGSRLKRCLRKKALLGVSKSNRSNGKFSQAENCYCLPSCEVGSVSHYASASPSRNAGLQLTFPVDVNLSFPYCPSAQSTHHLSQDREDTKEWIPSSTPPSHQHYGVVLARKRNRPRHSIQ